MQPLILPLETDESIRINGYRDGRGIRVVFQEGGFINIGLFRRAYHVVASGEETSSGPVTIRVSVDDDDSTTMEVRIEGSEKTVSRTLPPHVCDEIDERLRWADALLSTYDARPPSAASRPTAASQRA